MLDACRPPHDSTFHSSCVHHRAHDAVDRWICARMGRGPRAGLHTLPTDDDEGQKSTLTTNTDTDRHIDAHRHTHRQRCADT